MEIGQIRQGDVLLVPDEASPPSGVVTQTEVILALGEATGHAHRLIGTIVEWKQAGQRYIRSVGVVGSLSHEDHDPQPAAVVVANQTYKVIPQKEWDLSGQWKPVQD